DLAGEEIEEALVAVVEDQARTEAGDDEAGRARLTRPGHRHHHRLPRRLGPRPAVQRSEAALELGHHLGAARLAHGAARPARRAREIPQLDGSRHGRRTFEEPGGSGEARAAAALVESLIN